MLLGNLQIAARMKTGQIVIEPFNPDQLGPNSYDVRIAAEYKRPARRAYGVFLGLPEQGPEWEDATAAWLPLPGGRHPGVLARWICVPAGETILAYTQEVVGTQPVADGRDQVVAMMHARSSIARHGLSVCKCAGFGDIGYVNRWTMEISNHTKVDRHIPVGLRVAQMGFSLVYGADRSYATGKYNGKPAGWTVDSMLPRLEDDWDAIRVLAGLYE